MDHQLLLDLENQYQIANPDALFTCTIDQNGTVVRVFVIVAGKMLYKVVTNDGKYHKLLEVKQITNEEAKAILYASTGRHQ